MVKCVPRLKIEEGLGDKRTMANPLSRRRNQLERTTESWRPPLFRPVKTRGDRWFAAARRFFDLQAGSIWNDLSLLLPERRGFVLDAGCGAQPYRSLVNPEATYQGIDHADAERHFGYSMPDTTYYQGDRWPVSDASVDVVLSTETLEHVPEPPVYLSQALRCLKPGGMLILTVPFAARWHFIPNDYWRFTPSGLQRLLSATGFRDIAVFARGNVVTVACYKVTALLLPLVMPQAESLWKNILRLALGILTLPFMIMLALIANLSLFFEGGDDCLGYTVTASR
jgi:SAM-dependent methyltransferase